MDKIIFQGIHSPGWVKNQLLKAQKTCLSRSPQRGPLLTPARVWWPFSLILYHPG